MLLPQRSMAVLVADLGQMEMIKTLPKYDIISGPIDGLTLDAASLRGQVAITWYVKVVARNADEVQVEVGGQYNTLKGIGNLLTLKKRNGVWKVIDRIVSWIS